MAGPRNDATAFRDVSIWFPEGGVARIACSVAAWSVGTFVSSKVVGHPFAVAHRPIQGAVLRLRSRGAKLRDGARCVPRQIPVIVPLAVDEKVVRGGRRSPSAGQIGVGVRTREFRALVPLNSCDC